MTAISRRRLLQLSGAAAINGIMLPTSEHLLENDKMRLYYSLGKSIGDAWKSFHTADNTQVLAIGKAQLYLMQQTQAILPPDIQSLFYSAIYRLIGATLFFQERIEEAEHAHNSAYIAALEGADIWNMAQSRSWQAYIRNSQGRFIEAFQIAEAACNLISRQQDIESIRLHARLLAFAAENAASSGDVKEVQIKLHASEQLLEYLLDPHQEFDQNSWLQTAGICALHLGQYDIASTRLRQSLEALPPEWRLRYVSTAVPLATTLTRMKKLEEALEIAQQLVHVVQVVQSARLARQFSHYLQAELLTHFPKERRCLSFAKESQKQLALVSESYIKEG